LLDTVRIGQWTQSEQVKNGLFGMGCWWFQLFFIDFQLFYFLIIPVIDDPFCKEKCDLIRGVASLEGDNLEHVVFYYLRISEIC
jgi:hypothetical protein